MKISYFAIGLIIIGALIFGAAYAGHPLAIVKVGQTTFSDTISSVNSMPSSTSSSTPTTFSENGYQDLGATWGSVITQISDVDASGTGSVTVTITDSSGYSTTETMTNSWRLQYLENYLTKTPYEFFSAQASYNFTNPYPTQGIVYTFTFTGSAAYDGGTFNYQTITTYGEFPLQSVQNLGHFYLQIGNTTPVKIANDAAMLYYNVSGTSTTFQIWYVEDNGTTTPFTNAYFTYIYGTTQGQVTLTAQTTLNGYTAYTSSRVTIPVPTTLYLSGYVVANGAQGSPYQLMDFASNLTSLVQPPSPAFSQAQYVSFGIGGALMLIGVVWIFRK